MVTFVAKGISEVRKYFLTQPSPEQIFLSTLDTAYQITLASTWSYY
jgi:hypothetical protein